MLASRLLQLSAIVGTTPVINFLATPTDYALNFPIVAAPSRLMGIIGRLNWVTHTGGPATTTLTYSVGNNAPNFDNMLTAAVGLISTAAINAAVLNLVLPVGAGSNSVDVSVNAMRLRIATVPAGVTGLSGWFAYTGQFAQPLP